MRSSIPQNLGVPSKVTTLAMDSMFFFADLLLRLQAVFRVAGENFTLDVWYHHIHSSFIGMICTNRLMNPIERITNRATTNFCGLPTYDLRSLGCIIYKCIFGSSYCNFDCQQINSFIYFYILLLPFLCNFYYFTFTFLSIDT